MFSCDMLINNEPYKALFLSIIEISDFIDDNEAEGNFVTNVCPHMISWQDALTDDDFGWDYRIELISDVLIPGYAKTHKLWEIEQELERLGYI